MFICRILGTIILETDADSTFKSVKEKCGHLDNQMEGNRFSFKFVSKLNSCGKELVI